MKVVYLCKAVDESHPHLATQVRWIRSLAAKPQIDHVRVLTPSYGSVELPANVTVDTFPESSWADKLRFYRHALPMRRADVDFFFVAKGGPYPAMVLPLKFATRRPLYQWKAQSTVSAKMRFYAKYCDDLVFTSTPGSFPLPLDKVRIVGHGIDTEMFPFQSGEPTRDLVTIGRIRKGKGLEKLVRAVAECRSRFSTPLTLDMVGSCAPQDEPYRARLVELIDHLGLDGDVRVLEPVKHEEVPELLSQYRAGINFSSTAFDKAAAEAMASGLPVITTNACTQEALPADLRSRLSAPADDLVAQAEVLHEVLSWDRATRAQVGHQLRDIIVRDHSLDSFFDKILAHIDEHLRGSSPVLDPSGR